jgi:hypothetical protein
VDGDGGCGHAVHGTTENVHGGRVDAPYQSE